MRPRLTLSSARALTHPSLVAILDQGVYSATNFLLLMAVARATEPERFARFSAIYLAYLLALSILRAAGGQLLLLRPSSVVSISPPWSSALLAATLVLFAGSLWVATGDATLLALSLPIVGLQDLIRYVLLSSRRMLAVLWTDCTWLVVQIGALGLLEATNRTSAMASVATWVGGASASALVGLGATRGAGPSGSPAGGADQGDRRRWFVLDALLAFGRNQGYVLLFAGLVGWSGAGAMRLCFAVLGVVPVVVMGMVSAYLPLLASDAVARTTDPLVSNARSLQLAAAGIGGVAVAGVWLVEALGLLSDLLGPDTWRSAAPLFAWISLVHLGYVLQAPAQILCMARVGVDKAVMRKGILSVVSLCAVAAGLAISDTPTGGAVGLALGELVAVISWQITWRRQLRGVSGVGAAPLARADLHDGQKER